jgi:hypothetical protein
MSKVKVEKWLKNLKIEKYGEHIEYFKVEGFWWSQIAWGHGKSKGLAHCPCCKGETEFYVWSMAGSGKKCNNCGVVMHLGGVSIDRKTYDAYLESQKGE